MVDAIGPQYQHSLRQNYRWMIKKNAKYVKDIRIRPDDPIEKGVDCSRYKYLVYKWSGVPGIQRTTSERMSRGESGWAGRDIPFEEAEEFDLLFWSFTKDRVNGHVGTLLRDPKTGIMPGITHASSSRGVIWETMPEWGLRKMTKVRRITIGE